MTEFKVNAFRAYFALMNGLTAGDPALSRIALNFGDGSETESLNDKVQMINEKEAGAWYDLQGRKVNVQSSMFNVQSKKGLYIHNNRKVVIK